MRSRAGFTLIEALVAIAIVGIVATLVWGGFSQTARNKRIVERQLDRHHIIQSALGRMARELKMAFVSAQQNPNESLRAMRTAFVGGDARIDFTSFSHERLVRNSKTSDQNELSYFVTSHPDKRGVDVLVRREQRRIDDKPREGGRADILVEDVEDLQLEYLDPQTGEWLRSWDTTQAAMQPNRLPSQVKIRLTVADPMNPDDETKTFGTRATLPLRWALNHATYK